MVQMTVEYEGDLRCRGTHGPSGCEILTDAPVDNQGKGESFSPTDLLGTSLASCMLTIMAIAARRSDRELTGAKATVTKHMVADPRRRVGAFEVEFSIPGEWDSEARKTLEHAARTCPVSLSISPAIDVSLRFHWI